MNDALTLARSDEYQSLVDDCKAIITEAVYLSRWELIVGYHALGARIVNDSEYKRHEQGGGVLSGLSKDTGINERDLYRSIQFYKKYPSLDLLPDGKNISWNKIINNLLPEKVRTPEETERRDRDRWLDRLKVVASYRPNLDDEQMREYMSLWKRMSELLGVELAQDVLW